jgi:predicted lipoprotein with Yx(FWY)xxD motif
MKIHTLVAVTATALLTLSACGSGSTGSTATPPSSNGAGTSGSGLGVATTSLGKVLVDAQGMTLYVLSADGHDHSTCATQCLQFWPAVSPVGSGQARAATGHTATPDGTAIATVAGHPVYTFALDHHPGDVNGEGVNEFGGTWYAVSPAGQPVTGTAGASTPSTSSAAPYSGGGY